MSNEDPILRDYNRRKAAAATAATNEKRVTDEANKAIDAANNAIYAANNEIAVSKAATGQAKNAELSALEKAYNQRSQQVAQLKTRNAHLQRQKEEAEKRAADTKNQLEARNAQLEEAEQRAETTKAKLQGKIKRRDDQLEVARMYRDLSNEEWIEKSNYLTQDAGVSPVLSIQFVKSPFAQRATAYKPVHVLPFNGLPQDLEQLAAAARAVAMRGEDDSSDEEPDDGIEGISDWKFPKGQRRAIIGSSSVWERIGFFVEQLPDDIWTSKAHAIIHYDKDSDTYYWQDSSSKYGSYLVFPQSGEGMIVGGPAGKDGPIPLQDGTIVLIGDTVLLIRLPTGKEPARILGTKKRKTTSDSDSEEEV